eukprot:Sdes_comp19025_c0_seq2m9584
MGESEEEEVELSFLVDQMKIFWPQSFDFSPSGFGFLVGFFLDPFTICISCILQNVDASQISACLNQLETSSKENHSNFKKFCNASPILLGIFASPDISKSIFLEQLENARNATHWFNFTTDETNKILLWEAYRYGIHYRVIESCFITYPRVSNHKFISLSPLNLDLSNTVHVSYQNQLQFVVNQINSSVELDIFLKKSPDLKDIHWKDFRFNFYFINANSHLLNLPTIFFNHLEKFKKIVSTIDSYLVFS